MKLKQLLFESTNKYTGKIGSFTKKDPREDKYAKELVKVFNSILAKIPFPVKATIGEMNMEPSIYVNPINRATLDSLMDTLGYKIKTIGRLPDFGTKKYESFVHKTKTGPGCKISVLHNKSVPVKF